LRLASSRLAALSASARCSSALCCASAGARLFGFACLGLGVTVRARVRARVRVTVRVTVRVRVRVSS
jgi:hypothetical protein